MNVIHASRIALDVERIRKMVGLNAVFPYKEDDLVDAIVTLYRALAETTDRLEAKIATLEAQLRAANARSAKHAKTA